MASQESLARTKLWLPKETDHILHNETHSRQSALKEKHFAQARKRLGVKFKSSRVQTMQGQRNRGTVHTSWNVSFCQVGMHKKRTHIHVSSLICGEVLRWKFVERKKSQLNAIKKKSFFSHLYTIVISQLYCFQSLLVPRLRSAMHCTKASSCLSIPYASTNTLFFSHPTTQDRTTRAMMSLQQRRKINTFFLTKE